MKQLRFRARVMLMASLMGGVMTLMFAWASIHITEHYEHVLVEAILDSMAEDYSAQFARGQPFIPMQGTRLQVFLDRHDAPSTAGIPASLKRMAPGIRELDEPQDEGIHIGVFDVPAGRLYIRIDLGDIEELEILLRWMFLGVCIFGLTFSAWVGWLIGRRAAAALEVLAAAVDALPQEPEHTRFTAGFADDEIGRLARAIDGYQARLVDASAAERRFFADASHELRTPVTVARGALELLAEDVEHVPVALPRLQRVQRGLQELSDLMDALFRLARRNVGAFEQVDAGQWLGATLGDLLRRHAPAVQLHVDATGVGLKVPTRAAELVLGSVVRQLVPPGSVGRLCVVATPTEIRFRLDGDERRPSTHERARAASSDEGLAPGLIGRLAQAIGWELMEADGAGSVRIRMSPPPGPGAA